MICAERKGIIQSGLFLLLPSRCGDEKHHRKKPGSPVDSSEGIRVFPSSLSVAAVVDRGSVPAAVNDRGYIARISPRTFELNDRGYSLFLGASNYNDKMIYTSDRFIRYIVFWELSQLTMKQKTIIPYIPDWKLEGTQENNLLLYRISERKGMVDC